MRMLRDQRLAREQLLGTRLAFEKQHVEVGQLALRAFGARLGDRQAANFDAVGRQVRRPECARPGAAAAWPCVASTRTRSSSSMRKNTWR